MFNYKKPEAVMLLTQAVPRAEQLVLDLMEGRLSPDQVEQVLGICGVSSAEDALKVIRKKVSALVAVATVHEEGGDNHV